MNQTNPIEELIALFGGTAVEMARRLGHKYPSTIQAWKNNGRIPKWRRPEIEASGVRIPKSLLDRCVSKRG